MLPPKRSEWRFAIRPHPSRPSLIMGALFRLTVQITLAAPSTAANPRGDGRPPKTFGGAVGFTPAETLTRTSEDRSRMRPWRDDRHPGQVFQRPPVFHPCGIWLTRCPAETPVPYAATDVGKYGRRVCAAKPLVASG